ncbi:hypothetical protein SDJN03_00059, partial [Cucurbita argyrosperma subsp. sororia]
MCEADDGLSYHCAGRKIKEVEWGKDKMLQGGRLDKSPSMELQDPVKAALFTSLQNRYMMLARPEMV